jgi:hypothetical protein
MIWPWILGIMTRRAEKNLQKRWLAKMAFGELYWQVVVGKRDAGVKFLAGLGGAGVVAHYF